jgi:hypothetical protein
MSETQKTNAGETVELDSSLTNGAPQESDAGSGNITDWESILNAYQLRQEELGL